MTTEGWKKKRKGAAVIWIHPSATDGRAIVQNHLGVFFGGRTFKTVEEAKSAALTEPPVLGEIKNV